MKISRRSLLNLLLAAPVVAALPKPQDALDVVKAVPPLVDDVRTVLFPDEPAWLMSGWVGSGPTRPTQYRDARGRFARRPKIEVV